MQLAFTDSIASAQRELVVEIARTPEQIIEAKRLRYRVYCEERGFEAGDGGLEQDTFDDRSHHVLVRSRANGNVYGTVRVARSVGPGQAAGFPMEQHCHNTMFTPLPREKTGEVSRFALLRDRSGISPAGAALMRLGLIQGVVRVCGEQGINHLCALMERTLLRLLQVSSIHFVPVGPAIEHRGLRHPTVWQVADGLERVWRENRMVWSFITGNGLFWPETANIALASRLVA